VADESPIIALVVAVAENGVIGRNGRLPWRIPSELQHFKRITMGKPLIMGRNTFASLKKPLEGRDNIVLTRNADYAPNGAIVAHDADKAIDIARRCAKQRGADEIMVIGGAEIYTLMFPHARRIYLTRIHAAPEGDVHFPAYDAARWREREARLQSRGPKDDHDYTLSVLERI
jgi:dihydrofolate reductase